MLTIGSCGFSSTGSSVVTDVLKEYSDNIVLDTTEFTLTWCADGIEDLRYHMFEGCRRDLSNRIALERFVRRFSRKDLDNYQMLTNGKFNQLTEKYIDDITQVKWIGPLNPLLSNRFRLKFNSLAYKMHAYEYLARMEHKKGHGICMYPLKQVRMSIRPNHFEEISRKYVMDILDAMGRKPDKNVVLDQPFSGNNPQASFAYFENPRAVVVDRDPRDYYLFVKTFLYKKGIRQIPAYNAKDFVQFYRSERENQPYKEKRDDVIVLQFEDFIYQYEKTRKTLLEFCNVNPNSWTRKIFEPDKSIHNTQLFNRYHEYDADIEYISKELPEYLYPFEKYGNINTEGEMFFGKSALNK